MAMGRDLPRSRLLSMCILGARVSSVGAGVTEPVTTHAVASRRAVRGSSV